jgi:Cu/Ag efflux protein CusF
MMKRRTLLLALALLAGCAKQAPEKRYTLTGDIVGVDPKTRMAMIKGDKIEGWMEAMTMEYPVKDSSEFAKLAAGDRITATVFVGEANYHIGDIKVTGKAGTPK